MISGAKANMRRHKGYYQSLLDEHRVNPTPFLRQIETDLHRTFPDLIDFSAQYGSNPRSINKLRDVLVAYAVRNPRVGYCQVRLLSLLCAFFSFFFFGAMKKNAYRLTYLLFLSSLCP